MHMAIDAARLTDLIEVELSAISDERVKGRLRRLLVTPNVLLRDWDYGESSQWYPCWLVLRDDCSEAAIGYCEYGFGPQHPWGLISANESDSSMGMDSGWFRTFLRACLDSVVVIGIPMWRVFKTDAQNERMPISDEGVWNDIWAKVAAYRVSDPENRYDCSCDLDEQVPY
jgi:hypothetical protein